MTMNLKDTVDKYIRRHHLLRDDGKYLVALSGGADSVCLLLLLHQMGYRVEACHCNFHLRGEESDRDEAFCTDLCQRLSVPIHRIHFDTREYAALHKESIELAARNLRYRYFRQLRQDIGADAICVAHHQDDSVETVLINLLRGTGIKGLRGILPVNGDIVRPLLCASRNNILEYLQGECQPYVTDSSNLVDDVVRNKIRIHVIPMLRSINPAVVENIANMANHLQEADKILEATLGERIHKRQDGDKTFIATEDILGSPSAEYALFHSLSPYGFGGSAIGEILTSIHVPGKLWQSATHQLTTDRRQLILRPIPQRQERTLRIPETGTYRWTEEQRVRLATYHREPGFQPSRSPWTATLDADKVGFPLLVRPVRQGDRFQPFGMKGSKLISDYLTDRKLNRFEKEEKVVVEDANHHIVWLVGERTAEPCKITDKTKRVLEIRYDDHQ